MGRLFSENLNFPNIMAHTEVILREKITNLGAEADVVKVRRGYARNFLLPQGKAFEATKGNLRNIESLKIARGRREAEEMAQAESQASKIKRQKFVLELATGEQGKAFGSITVNDLVKAVAEKTGIDIDRHAIKLDKPIKSTGKFDIPVKLHADVEFDLRLTVEAKGGEKAADDAGAE
ncbi:MAG: large subunit ribosomal protein L9 [Verrucomicrobiales bacterium]|jgi:large subunit ribosomal protein L9